MEGKRCGEWDADARIDVNKGVGELSYNPLQIRKVDVSNEYFDHLMKFEQIDQREMKWSTKTLREP